MRSRQVMFGGLLLFVSCLTLIQTGTVAEATPLYLAATASLALAIGSVLVGSPRRNPPV